MSVNLYMRAAGSLPPGIPTDIVSVFDTQEAALAQAVHDIQQGNRWHLPQRIEGEDGATLMDRPALEKAAAAA